MIYIEFPGGTTSCMPTLPLEIGEHDFDLCSQAPSIGRHTIEVLSEAGLCEVEIAALVGQGGVVRCTSCALTVCLGPVHAGWKWDRKERHARANASA